MVELWAWLFNPRERAATSAIPGVEELRDLPPPLKRGLASLAIAAIGRLPRRLRYSQPVFRVLQARFRAVPRTELASASETQGFHAEQGL